MNKFFFIFILLLSFCIKANEIEILSDVPGKGIEINNHFKITVNYRGTLENGNEFDNSFKRKQPFVFQIGLRQVIPGWEKGLMGMKVGGKRTLKIPPSLGYGSRGAGDLIPPNSTLIFEIEIIDAKPPGYKKIFSKDLQNYQHQKFILIDIRTLNERKHTGVIENSLEITAFDIDGNFDSNFIKAYQEIASKDNHVIFISNKGEISAILANGFVEQLGAKNMYTLVGGVQNWIKEGGVLTK